LLHRFAPWILPAGDLAAVMLFVIIGQRDHGLVNEARPALGVLLTTAEFAGPWVLVGWRLGIYRRSEPFSVRGLLGRSLTAWLAAAPLGILMRALVLGRAVVPVSFIAAALVFGGLFLLGWRLVFALAWARWRTQAAAGPS